MDLRQIRIENLRAKVHAYSTKSVLVSLLLSFLVSVPSAIITSAPAQATASGYTVKGLTCDTQGDDNVYVTASHGQAFYVDGTGTNATDQDASYIGYQISLKSGSPYNNVWVKISSFTSSTTSGSYGATPPTIVPVAGATDKQQIADSSNTLTTSDTRTAFFLLKATNVNAWGNSSSATGTYQHTVEVYSGNPDIGGSLIRSCTYKFINITNTTAASANKVTSLSLSDTAPHLGETVTITVNGQTGTIGAGTTPDNDIIWLTAAPYSSFPISAMRLTQTSFTGSNSGCTTAKINQLLILNASTNGCQGNYVAKYTFTIIGSGSASQIVAPIAQIASGTQVKHTTVTSTTINLATNVSLASIQFAKGIITPDGAADSVTVGSTKYALVQYVETATVASGSATIDYVVDSPTSGAIIETTTANGKIAPTYQIGSAGTPTTIIPVTSGGKNYFNGPFTFTSSNPLIIKYWMLLPINGTSTTYKNTAVAYIADHQIAANGGIPLATVVVSNSGGITGSTGYQLSNPDVTTKAATLVTNTTAQLNGSLDQKSETTTLYFDWGTNETLTTFTRVNVGDTTTAGIDTKTSVTGLTTGTTYYFRIVGVGQSGLTDTGTILSFVAGTTFVTTVAPTNITFTKATLNGQYSDVSNTTLTYKFYYDSTTAVDSTTPYSVNVGSIDLHSSTAADTSTVLTGLRSGVTYYYRLIAFTAGGAQVAQGEILSFTTGSVTTSAATSITGTGATLNGSFTFGDDSATSVVIGFTYATSADLTTDSSTVRAAENPAADDSALTYALSGLVAGTTYYFRAYAYDGLETITATILSFVATAPGGSRTLIGPNIVWPNPATITYPTPLSGTQLNAVAQYGGSTVPGTYTYQYPLGTILNPGTYTMTVMFNPSDPSTYASIGTTVTITVIAPVATITWPNPSSVTGPYTLSPTQLNATCSVPGRLVYNPALGTVLPVGSYTLSVTCYPTDPNIAPVTTQVPFNVVNNLPTITWPTPTPVVGPATLSPTQLNAVCSVPGTLTYNPALGTVLPVGSYTLSVTCTPTDPRLSPISTTVPFVVTGVQPTITWPTPTPMTGPATLSPTQLNATCSVAGTLTYDPPLGTVYTNPGTYTLKVTCTPTDPKLPPVTTTVQLVILGGVSPVRNATTGPNTFTQGYVKWDASPNAVSYVVDIRGAQVCKTTSTSCIVDATIGPKTPVTVTAIGAKGDKAPVAAKYFNDKLLPAIIVNFATNSYLIDAKSQKEIVRVTTIIKREGFTYVEITGHTDPRGGALNVALSNNRAKALQAAMLKLVPTLEFKNAGLSYDDPKASNKTAAGMATNRRSEGAVK